MLGSPESKPAFLSERNIEPIIKNIVRKFPVIDTKSNSSQVAAIHQIKADVTRSLSLYYYTFVDILEFRDHVTDLLTTIDACQVYFDITVNFDLTKGYLDLIVTYVSIMILLSRVEDRKAVLGLFNFAHELQSGRVESSFPRLGQMIIEYDPPIKKLSEEFIPHSKCLMEALLSLRNIYHTRALKAEDWRAAQMLSLLSDSSKIMSTARSDTMPCEYLSLDVIERWITIGFLLCHQHLIQNETARELWEKSLQNNYITLLCRDEVLHTHLYIISFFETIKGYSKRVAEVKEWYQQTVTNAPKVHREKRKFLRSSLKELTTIFTDQPGLLGPKALYVFIGLSLARDEFHWLLRHINNPPPKKANVKYHAEDFNDRQIPELMFHLEELRALVRKYNQVMQRYFVQYLSGYDAALLNHLVQDLNVCPEDESMILSSFYNTIASLSVKQVEENQLFDFSGLRLDWFRLQAYSSVNKAGLVIKDHHSLAKHINTIVFHTKMVDYLDEMLIETSDLSIYCFYTTIFENQFKQCMEFPAQHRYSIAFPMVCAHFMQATHELCPEERHSIGTTSVQYAHWFLKEMSEEVNQVITAICEEQSMLADKLLPKNCAAQIAQNVNRKKNKDRKNKLIQEPEKPGVESLRKHREEFTRMDKLHMALTELCFAINYCGVITVWEHGFVPREFFTQQLEIRFNKALVGMMMYNPETGEIAKPSELLNSVRAIMNVLQSIENYVHVDISRVFNNVLPQQTQPLDSCNGEKTITSNYTQWYLEVLLRRVSSGHIVYSPNRKAFVSLATEGTLPFTAEEYADLMELRALAELIGPYGMKYLSERLMWHISSQVDELKKLVILNKDVLKALRTSFDKPEQMKELQRRLQTLAQEALLDVLDERIPFLLSSIKDFQQHVPNGQDSMIVNEMASAAGLPCDIDPALCAALRSQKTEVAEDDYKIACLMMVFVAVALPRLARSDFAVFKASLEGHANNIHCLGRAINALAGAMFTIHGTGDVEERLKEFLALASSSLLRLGQETDKELIKNRESVYLLLDQLESTGALSSETNE
ncbi:hypothetical protein LSH36_308g01013 [Paralvinella palmiformis]|uniref:Membrane-associated protein Hem n=1 Tax=Paralvinella palmiformis TaxID=53620 RepID=A0AAD9JH49_9ANNE|nr:hypothetical protein LSH36_308g01013 [Paralvinella palmiformis]